MLHCFIICLGHHCPLHPVVCRAAANFRHLCLSVASLVTDPKVFCMALSLSFLVSTLSRVSHPFYEMLSGITSRHIVLYTLPHCKTM